MSGAHAAEDPYRQEACTMFAYINADRALFAQEAGNAGPVAWSEEIWAVAVAHTNDMCDRGFFDHTNPDGLDPSDRAAAGGLDFGVSENISVNLDPGAAMWGFMEEPTCRGHRLNILNPRAIEVGIGYTVCNNPANENWGDGYHHITMDFREDWNIDESDFCNDPAKACQIPPNPPTSATCPQNLIDWDFCPAPGDATIAGWGC